MVKERALYALILVILFLFVGTIFYSTIEGWTSVDSLYFSAMTLTTVGYGDLYPTTIASKLFTSFYAVFGVGTMFYVFGTLISKYLVQKESLFDNFVLKMHDLKLNRHGKIVKQKK